MNTQIVDGSFVSILSGSFLIICTYLWHKWDRRTKNTNQQVGKEDLLVQFALAVTKVGILMFGVLLIGVPVSEIFVSQQESLEKGIQAFNGVSAVVFGLAIAAAGAWVSIRLAHVATEIASNQYYSEESKKRYDEAKEVADIIRELDLRATKLLVSTRIFADRLQELPSFEKVENKAFYLNQLRELSEEALSYSLIYQQALQVPTFLEAIYSERFVCNELKVNCNEKSKPKQQRSTSFKQKILGLLTNQKAIKSEECSIFSLLEDENLEFLKEHFRRLHFCLENRQMKINEDEVALERTGGDPVYSSLKHFNEIIQENALSIICAIDDLKINLPILKQAVEEIVVDVNNQKEVIDNQNLESNRKNGETDILEQQKKDVISFYVLDFLFIHGVLYDGKDISNRTKIFNQKDNTKGSDSGVGTKKGADNQFTSSSATIDNSKTDRGENENKTSFSTKDAKSGKIPEVKSIPETGDTKVNFDLENSSTRREWKIASSFNLRPPEESVIREGPKTKLSANLVKASAFHFASALYIVPRLPRELLSLRFKNIGSPDAQALRRFNIIKRLYACDKGIHILKTGRVGSHDRDHADAHSMELQLYVFRTLATSNDIGNRLMIPFFSTSIESGSLNFKKEIELPWIIE